MQAGSMLLGVLALALGTLLAPVEGKNAVEIAAANLGLTPELYNDRLALLALKSSIAPSGFGASYIKTGWPSSPNDPNFNPCGANTVKDVNGVLQNGSWPHIICYQKRVIQLKLTSLNITGGDLPPEMAKMSALNALYMGGNKFSGTIPNEWAGKRLLPALTIIRLNDNRLTGTLPPWNRKGAFAALAELYLDNNRLEGSLPPSWAGANRPLRNLVTLSLSRNFLGRMPDGAGGYTYVALPNNASDWGRADLFLPPFPRLRTLNLDRNSFTGLLPDTWGQQYAYSALKKLYLGNNGLTGTLPSSWGGRGAFKSLQELQIQWNNLGDPDNRGGLPTSWKRALPPRAFPSLQTLMLFNGNSAICGEPAQNNVKLQGDAAYVITDPVGRVYTPSGTWRAC